MSEAVKTTLLKALEAMLQGLPGVAAVRRDWQFPFDLAAVDDQGQPLTPLPALFFYEEEDEERDENLLTEHNLQLDLVLFGKFAGQYSDETSACWQTFKDCAMQVAAQIHNLLHARENLEVLAAAGMINLERNGPGQPAPCNDDYGEMVYPIRLTYGHRLGDAFNLDLH